MGRSYVHLKNVKSKTNFLKLLSGGRLSNAAETSAVRRFGKKMQQNVPPHYDFALECIRINSNFVHAPNYSDMLKKIPNSSNFVRLLGNVGA